MRALLTAEEAAEVDAESVQTFRIPSLVLMERAALAVTDTLIRDFRPDAGTRILCVCTYGNNGADGLAAARQLHERGFTADVLLFGSREKKGTEELERQREILAALNIPVYYAYEMPVLASYDIIIDAIFGIGLDREVKEPFASLIKAVNNSGARVLSVDIASGVMAATGQIEGTAIRADETVTFGYAKRGHVLYPGAACTGKLTVAPIGFAPEPALSSTENWVRCPGKEELAFLPPRPADSNKGTYGRALLVAGSQDFGGAACLAASAAYRTGAGLVEVLTHQDNRLAVLGRLPEAIVSTWESAEEAEGKLDISMQRAACIAAGPGLGTSQAAHCLVHRCLETNLPLILDADALNCLAAEKDAGIRLLGSRRALTVITPHMGEMSRLMGEPVAALKRDIIAAASGFAARTGTIVVLKDARTVITDGNHTWLNCTGNSGMSVGGSGDVLTGILAGLFAQAYAKAQGQKEPACVNSGADDRDGEAVRLAAIGVYLHGAAGDTAAQAVGGRSMLAEDIVRHLADVLK